MKKRKIEFWDISECYKRNYYTAWSYTACA